MTSLSKTTNESFMMKHQTLRTVCTIALLGIALAGCQPENSADVQTDPSTASDPALVVDMHTSRNSLDWPGRYEGLLACADCPGVHTQVTLEPDGRFEIVTRRLVRDAAPSAAAGQFDWESGGNTIVLATEAGPLRFAVGEGRLLQMESGQTQPTWGNADATLAQSTAGWHGGSLADALEDHDWLLTRAADAANRSIDALFPDAAKPFEFRFAESRLHAQGGCNGLRGSYRIDADDRLAVTAMMSSMMACPEPLMEADAALAALLAEPLETTLVRGHQPTLVLLTQGGEALMLTGELTPEAQFGAATTIFLEVDAEPVACEDSPRDDGLCLNVRERTFDEQGLPVGEPSEWQTFTADIQGYQHDPGIRTVLRVKRFDPPPGPDMPPGPVFVLDLMVQSEVVPG